MHTSVRFVGIAVSVLLASCAEVDGVVDDGVEPTEPAAASEGSPQVNPAWVEELAPGVDPCGGAPVDTCGAATHGACGAIAIEGTTQCLPRFDWGVLPDGTVELASSERRFRIVDLERAPLSEVEEQEALELADAIASAPQQEDEGADGEPGLIAIDHSGRCSVIASWCESASPFVRYYKYSSHYNYMDGLTYRHRHVIREYLLGTTCGPTGVSGYVYRNCGTP